MGDAVADGVRVAVLIDCDNISWQLGGAVLAEAAKTGTLGVKRGYGDWSSSYLSGWKSQLPGYAIQPMQQAAYVAGRKPKTPRSFSNQRIWLNPATAASSSSLRAARTLH